MNNDGQHASNIDIVKWQTECLWNPIRKERKKKEEDRIWESSGKAAKGFCFSHKSDKNCVVHNEKTDLECIKN